MSPRAPLPSVLATALLLAAPLAAQDEDRRERELLDEVGRALLAADDPALPERLAALGSEVGPVLLDVLERRRFPFEREGRRHALVLRAEHEAALYASLARLPRGPLREHLAATAGAPYREASRRAALDALGAFGEAADVPLALSLAADGAPGAPPSAVRSALSAAVARLVARDPGALAVVGAELERAPPTLLKPLVDALEGAPREPCLEALGRRLGRRPALDALLVVRLDELAHAGCRVADPGLVARVRERLESDDVPLLLASLRFARHAADARAARPAIALLEHPAGPVREAAETLLRHLSGQRLGTDAAAWSGWLAAELDWWEREGRGHAAALADGPPARAAEALREVAHRSLFRDDLVDPLARAIGRREPELATMACAALGRLGSRRAVPALADTLRHRNPAVRDAAHEALRRITGLDLGPDPLAWMEASR